MWRILAICFICFAVDGAVYAQEATETPTPTATETPTVTLTPSNTPTPTPDFFVVWTLPPPENTETPEATEPVESPRGQAVAFVYTVDAGQVAIAVILFAIWVTILMAIVIWLWQGNRGR